MRLENRSKNVLSITKSKAKMYEFDIDEELHIELKIAPQKLLFLTIGILGEFSALEARNIRDESYMLKHQGLKAQLIDVSQYFEALQNSKLETSYSDYLSLLGSVAFYLADMPGSSLVLAKDLEYQIVKLTPCYLEGILVWLLKNNYKAPWPLEADGAFEDQFKKIFSIFIECFDGSKPVVSLDHTIQQLRTKIYASGNDRELFFVDILAAITKRKLENSSVVCLPKYSKLPIENWIPLLQKNGFIREFWPAQKLLGEKGVFEGKSAVIQMPTSAGKTKSTELIIRSAFMSERTKLAVVVAPFRALCREISHTFESAFYQEQIKINELQDVPQLNFTDLEMLKDLMGQVGNQNNSQSIIVSTPEKLVYLLRHEPELAKQIGLLIFDEGHQFDSGTRGVTYELLIASLKSSVNEFTQKILISAVMPNAKSIGDWLYGEKGSEVKGTHCLPTIRATAFASWKSELGQLNYIDKDLNGDREFFVPRVIESFNLGRNKGEKKDRVFPERDNNTSIAAYLGVKLCRQAPTAIFCGAK